MMPSSNNRKPLRIIKKSLLIISKPNQQDQTAIMQKQLEAIIALAPAHPRVPHHEYFSPSSFDGISFPSTANCLENDAVSVAAASNQPIPPASRPITLPPRTLRHLQNRPLQMLLFIPEYHLELEQTRNIFMMTQAWHPFSQFNKATKISKSTYRHLTSPGFNTMHQKLVCRMGISHLSLPQNLITIHSYR